MENQENFENSFYNLSSDGIDKSILITKKALNNINLDINKWGEIKNKNLETHWSLKKKSPSIVNEKKQFRGDCQTKLVQPTWSSKL